jgi:CRP-like cAMP-binding protein
VSAVQPALTPVLGFAAFGDRLGPAQMLGGALVVAGVVVLEARGGLRVALESGLAAPTRTPRLARVAAAMEVPAGEPLVRQGAPGDAFYLIESGRASVTHGDDHIRDLEGGDFFGELAPLRDGERTASVVAASEMRVRAIPRRDFGPAMRQLATLARSVTALARERLGAVPVQPATT